MFSVCVCASGENRRVGCWSSICRQSVGLGCRLWCAVDRTALGSVCQRVKPLCAAVWTELFRVSLCCKPVIVTETDWHALALRGRSLQSDSFFPSIHVFQFLSFSLSQSLTFFLSSGCFSLKVSWKHSVGALKWIIRETDHVSFLFSSFKKRCWRVTSYM